MLEQIQNKLAFAEKVNATSMKEFNSSIVKKSSKTANQNCDDSRTESEVDTDEEMSKKGNSDDKSKNLFDEYELDDLTGVKDNKFTSVVPSDKPAAHKVSNNNNADKTQSDAMKDLIKDDDLYGKDWADEKMEKLIDKIYCKKSEYDLAKTLSSQATHVARRLITGVFKPSGYLTATYTGQAPRAHKSEKPALQIKPLNEIARNEIVDFALQLATNKGWKTRKGVPHTRSEIERAMSQRVGELKRSHELEKKNIKNPTG
ncbi:uncharacterized protein LOC141527336 [Cotesia typhae]|uniref:uncharacterized protein LOC141527336 n=1 Tax=Cotesia typhae TaxID=2053667 RepID=UPI003D685D9B